MTGNHGRVSILYLRVRAGVGEQLHGGGVLADRSGKVVWGSVGQQWQLGDKPC